MKTQADAELVISAPPKENQVGVSCGSASLFMRSGPAELPDVPLGTVELVLQAIQVMSNGWLLIGTRRMPSSKHKAPNGDPEQVHEWGITENIAWPSFVRSMVQSARSLGDSEASLVRYVRVRERQTRHVACKLWKEQKMPWGEAMQQAWTKDMSILWTVTAQSNAFGVRVSLPGITDVDDPKVPCIDHGEKRQRSPPSPRRRRSTSPPMRRPEKKKQAKIPKELLNISNDKLEQWMLCSDFNGHGCDAEKPSLCPRGRLHRCSFKCSDGVFCGATGHGRDGCPSHPKNGGNGHKARAAVKAALSSGRGRSSRSAKGQGR